MAKPNVRPTTEEAIAAKPAEWTPEDKAVAKLFGTDPEEFVACKAELAAQCRGLQTASGEPSAATA